MPLTRFHPTVRRWFETTIGTPSAPQREGWPIIGEGRHTLIAAPTGTGKTFAAFLWALDGLLRQGDALEDQTSVLYVSPLKALGNDVQKNLSRPLAALRAIDPALPEVRVLVRSGDTPQAERQRMTKRPPHVLVTTPESLYILLTSDGGRGLLRTVKTVIVDEIHAVAGDKRGAHLALSLERLEALCVAPPQRIGLSATQKPIEDVSHLLVGKDRACALVDVGHRRDLDLAIEMPESPLSTVCSTDTWQEIVRRMATLILEHRTTLVFVNTRKLAERVAGRLSAVLGEDQVTSHHGSLSRERRLEAEHRLKEGKLRALVATASLELGIDVGEVDRVLQAGVTPSIATLLQRVGRSGHALGKTPRGRIFPLTQDELVCAVALVDAVRHGELDVTPKPVAPLDVLAQQIVAACVPETWVESRLFDTLRRAWPYRDLTLADFDATVALHTGGRKALLHRDGVRGRLRATKRARITAMTSGGAIPDTGQYRVLLEPESIHVGTLDEDFAIESNVGDVFQLGNASWRVLKVEPGVMRVADAAGQPPTVPFWFGEAPARTRELSAAIARVREAARAPDRVRAVTGVSDAAATQLVDYVEEGARALGAMPTPECVVAERFFDESGGMQVVLHAPFGGRINRAWGLALRKKFCRGFGQELQAAANEEAIVFSLGLIHSFPLSDVFDYLTPETARDALVQAVLASPLFTTRWRWNLTRSLLLARTQNGGRRVPTPLLRMRADDALAAAFPEVRACGETLPAGDLPIPWDHPLVRQTLDDCLTEAMDVDGLLDVLQRVRDGRIRTIAIDTPTPSAFARGILNAAPYAFLDDAPLEERRTQAVLTRHGLDPKVADSLGDLDADAIARVRQEAWPDPENAEELHEALLWMGYASAHEAEIHGWEAWLAELAHDGRVERVPGPGAGEARWFAAEAPRDARSVLRGRLEALGPVHADADPELLALEGEGVILRCRIGGAVAWCERRLLARIHRATLERLRSEIEPVSAADLWRFLAAWQHADEAYRLEGPRGVLEVVKKLAGFEVPAAAWESSVLPARVRHYRKEWLDELTLTGAVVWGRLWSEGSAPIRATPVCLLPREDEERWLALSGPALDAPLGTYAREILAQLDARGASFAPELERRAALLPSHFEAGLAQLIAHGHVSCDSFGGLRRLVTPPSRRRGPARAQPLAPAGRWTRFRTSDAPARAAFSEDEIEFTARRLIARYGVVFRRLIERERLPVPWRDLVRTYRHLELVGDVRGGRFVQRFSGEQYALPEAVELMRRLRRRGLALATPLEVSAADPLNLEGILTPEARISAAQRRLVRVAGG